MKIDHGALVISLDFEIMWGVCDKPDIREYYLENLRGVRKVIPALVSLFDEYGIHATFATVGMLFASDKQQLEQYLPELKPQYHNQRLSPYNFELQQVGPDENQDPLHYASGLIEVIRNSAHQEIGCHTFCHYYCLEAGQSVSEFEADISSAITIAASKGIQLRSMVFPRNQFNNAYLDVLKKFGFTSYRGNEKSWMYEARNRDDEKLMRRLARLGDSYFNITGNNIYSWEEISATGPLYNIPASRFLRPCSSKLSFLEPLRAARIRKDMKAAAKSNRIYHLWWHPHNFGVRLEENLQFLRSLLEYYRVLNQQYRFRSMSMQEIVNRIEIEQ